MKDDRFSFFYRTLGVNSQIGKTCEKILLIYSDSNLRASDMGPVLLENQAYLEWIFKYPALIERIKMWFSETETLPDDRKLSYVVERITALLGKRAVRNLILSLRMNRVLDKGIRKKKNDKTTINPPDQLKYAILAEDYCEDRQMPDSDFAFLGGLHYDWLTAIAKNEPALRSEVANIDRAFKEGQAMAQIAARMAGKIKGTSINKHLIPAAWVLPIGKLLMGIYYPRELEAKSWGSFLSASESAKENRPTFFTLYESESFPVTHDSMLAWYVNAFSALKSVELAISFYQRPYLLSAEFPSESALSHLLGLTYNIHHKYRIEPFQFKWAKKNGLSEKDLIGA